MHTYPAGTGVFFWEEFWRSYEMPQEVLIRVAALARRTAREHIDQKTHLAGDTDGPRAEVDVGKGSQTEAQKFAIMISAL